MSTIACILDGDLSEYTSNLRSALEYVAKREGESIDNIRCEIDLTIAEARKIQDPKAQIFWKAIFCEGNHLTSEDNSTYCKCCQK